MLNTLNVNLNTDLKVTRVPELGIKIKSQDINNNLFILRFTDKGKAIELDETYTVEILTKFEKSKSHRLTSATVYRDYARWEFDTSFITQDEKVTNYVYVRKSGSLVVSADANAFAFDVGLSEIDKDAGRVAEVYDENYQKYLDEFKDNVDFEEIAQAEQERKEAEILRQESYDAKVDTAIVEADVVEKVDNKVTELTPQINNLTAQLAQKVGNGTKAKLEDLDEAVLSAIEGGEGTSFDLLSIPQDDSTTFEKLGADLKRTFNKNQINLYDPSLAVDGKVVNYGHGLISDFPTSAILGKQPVEEGKVYTLSMPSNENGFDYHFRCYDEQGVFIGNSGAYASSPVASGIQVTSNSLSGDRQGKVFALTADSPVRFVDIQIIFPYAEHTTDDFNRIRNSIQLEEGSSFTKFEVYGQYVPAIKEEAMPESYDTLLKSVGTVAGWNVLVHKEDKLISVRTHFNDTHDLIHLWGYPRDGYNQGLNLLNMYLVNKDAPKETMTGELFKSSADDITPFTINGVYYIGANHGYYDLITLTANSHGKTVTDIGSTWSINGKSFILFDVVDNNTLKVFSDFTGDRNSPTHTWTDTTGTLTHVTGATNTANIAYTASSRGQLFPNTNKKSLKLVMDEKEIADDGSYYGDKFDLVESYNITDIVAIQTYLKTLTGTPSRPNLSQDSLEGLVGVNNVFSHNRNGSITVKTGYEYLKDVSVAYYGVVQSISIGDKAYVPDVGTVSGLNLSDVVTQPASTSLSFAKSTWLNPEKPPYRYHQFSSDMRKGMALGYNPLYGVAKPSIRQNTGTAGTYNGSSKKMYPYVRTSGLVEAGDYEETIAFRVPLQSVDPDATALYWYWVGEDIFLAFDFHKNVDKTIELPSYMAGKKVEQLDIHENTTVQNEIVSAKGIKIKVSNDYGYGVLKLYD